MRKRGFTIVELLVVVGVVGLIVVLLLLGFTPPQGCHLPGRQMKDATQVRGIVQAMCVWAGSNNGRYPLPSAVDMENTTVAPSDRGAQSKDDTGNILSLLIYTGGISVDVCINPAESNTDRVQMDEGYQFDAPRLAADPDKALWDPGFAGTPIDPASSKRRVPGIANQSYAHVPPFGNRLSMWRDTPSTNTPVLGDRGPEYAGTTSSPRGKWRLLDGATGTDSNTLLIHGGRTTWEGNIAFADGHVDFMTAPTREGITYLRAGARPLDNIFVNETDEDGGDANGGVERGVNAFLRPIAQSAGPLGSVSLTLWKD